MPAIGSDVELSAWLAEHGYRRGPAAVRAWRDADLFEPRHAPGAGRGRHPSVVSDDDRKLALALARALDGTSGRVRLSEAAVAAWGGGAPVCHRGLSRALTSEFERIAAQSAMALGLLERKSRKATDRLSLQRWPILTRLALLIGLGCDVRAGELEEALRSTPLWDDLGQTGLVVAPPGDGGHGQITPYVAKAFEGPIQFAVLAGVARRATKLDLTRSLPTGQWLEALLVENGLMIPTDAPTGYVAALITVVVLSLEKITGPLNLHLAGVDPPDPAR